MKTIIREPEKFFSVIYDPEIKGSSDDRTSYEYCRKQIDDACEEGLFTCIEQKEWMIGKLNHLREIYILEERNKKH